MPPDTAAARRPVRHLPGRPVPAVGRLRRGQAAGARRLPGRGAARPDLLRPAGLQLRATAPTPSAIARRTIAALRRLRLRRGAVRLLRRHAARSTMPELFDDGSADGERARELAARTHELIELPGRRAWACETVAAELAGARHLPRQLLGPARARRQAPAAPAARERRGPGARRAGRERGLLRLRRHLLRQVPGDLDQDGRRQGRATIEATGAELVLAGDLGCLMNMAGRLKRLGSGGRGAPRRRGAGRRRSPTPPIGARLRPGRPPHGADLARLQGQRPPGAGRPGAAVGARLRPRPASGQARAAPPHRLPEFEALRDQARRSRTTRSPISTSTSRRSSAASIEQGGKVHWARDAAEARARRARALPRRRRALGDQEQEHDHRGDRPQRVRSRRTASSRSRPTSASTSCSSPASRRATSSAPAIHMTKERDRRPVRASTTAGRGSRTPRRWSPRRAGSCASATSRPMSASPAPTSWSPRPAR